MCTVLLSFLVTSSVWGFHEQLKEDGLRMLTKLAEEDNAYEDQDVAKVHLVQGHTSRRRRMTKRDLRQMEHIPFAHGSGLMQLDLSSGSQLDLNLRATRIVDEDTVVSYLTSEGRIERKLGHAECYYHGEVTDSTGTGWAAVSHCDGVFGIANSPGFEYLLHPVQHNTRTKRAADLDLGPHSDYDVHVLWRRSRPGAGNDSPDVSEDAVATTDVLPVTKTDEDENGNSHSDNGTIDVESIVSRPKRQASGAVDSAPVVLVPRPKTPVVTGPRPKKFVIEMAMFSDARYWKKLHALYPGREDDFLLTRLAGTQGLFSNKAKVGYEVTIKLKLLEYWQTDPPGYRFTQRLGNNLRLSCNYTTAEYAASDFDVHAINTGISAWNDGVIGLAFFAGTCRPLKKCFVMKPVTLESFVGFAHELGHTLGFSHHDVAQCPENIKHTGGFMGGGHRYNFSPCMKYQLEDYLSKGEGDCLFTESSIDLQNYTGIPSVFPGQARTPDGLCEIYAGKGYKFVKNEQTGGVAICSWFLCVNEVEDSAEYGRAKRFITPFGFACKRQSFCDLNRECKSWTNMTIAMDTDALQNLARVPEWSEWSAEFSTCSHSCGTGIRTRRRECIYHDLALEPYCKGMAVKPELCNRQPCPGEVESSTQIRKKMGDARCALFLAYNVELPLRDAQGYLGEMGGLVKVADVGPHLSHVTSKSCLLKCKRTPANARENLDGIMPDGSPCLDNERSWYALSRYNIDLRCTRGYCLEYSDCPDLLQKKDDCGVCGGDNSRCVSISFDHQDNVHRLKRRFLVDIPTCASNVDVFTLRRRNVGILLELWSKDEEGIIAGNGLYPTNVDYEGDNRVHFAGTVWSYNLKEGYLRAMGPLNDTVKIAYHRMGPPLDKIVVTYAKGV